MGIGVALDEAVGAAVTWAVGALVELAVGAAVGVGVGLDEAVGTAVTRAVGALVGLAVGEAVGDDVGSLVGLPVGLVVGAADVGAWAGHGQASAGAQSHTVMILSRPQLSQPPGQPQLEKAVSSTSMTVAGRAIDVRLAQL